MASWELFLEQELPALMPLPLHSDDCAEVALRVCDLEGCLEFETNRYPVPYEHVADILTLKATEQEILIYLPELDLIVRHERGLAGAKLSLDGAAIHGGKTIRYGLEPVREQFLNWAMRRRIPPGTSADAFQEPRLSRLLYPAPQRALSFRRYQPGAWPCLPVSRL